MLLGTKEKLSEVEQQMAECVFAPVPKGVKRLQYEVSKIQMDSRRKQKKKSHDFERQEVAQMTDNCHQEQQIYHS